LPGFTAGCLRGTFFFSFFGLIVSVLGFVLSVPLTESPFEAVESATWGMLVTVSVSTVIFCVDPSCFDLGGLADRALDCLVIVGGGTDEVLLPSNLLSVAFSAAGILTLGCRTCPSFVVLETSDEAASFS
jgi:hypothetical protein